MYVTHISRILTCIKASITAPLETVAGFMQIAQFTDETSSSRISPLSSTSTHMDETVTMDYNTAQQYPTPPHGSFNESSTFRPHSNPLMYSYGSFAQENQRGFAQSHSPYQQSPQSQNVHQQQQTRRNSQPASWNGTSHGISLDKLQDGAQVKQDDSNTHSAEATDQSAMHQVSFPSQSISHLGFQHHFGQSNLFKGSLDTNPMKTSIAEIELSELTATWNPKSFDTIEFPRLEPDNTDMGYPYMPHDEEGPIIIRPFYGTTSENENFEFHHIPRTPRRISDSSLSFSSSGAVPDVPCFDDAPVSEATPRRPESGGWDTAQINSSLLSPLPSPRREGDLSRVGNRSRASPSQHGSKRTSPYSIDKNRLKRWTTGNVASNSIPTSIPPRPMSHVQDRYTSYNQHLVSGHNVTSPYTPNPLGIYTLHQQHQQHVLYSQQHHNLQNGNSNLFTPSGQPFPLEIPRPVPSQGLFPLLQSNHGGCSAHFADLSDPPDLYSSLHEEPSNPPESDMNPSDPDLVPHEQDLRFTGDLYTPRWVRGHGNKREGWCGLCKPGRWLVLKNSAFWYDKSFTHGVSAATGAAFQSPRETRRTHGNLDVWEGLCGSCNDWIALVSSKKKGTTWFRHAYKCHTHPKVKDGPKRRRETSHQIRARTVSSASTTTTASHSISKESSHDPPTRSERILQTDTDQDSKLAADSSIRNASASSHDGSHEISANQLGGLGRVTSIFANLV